MPHYFFPQAKRNLKKYLKRRHFLVKYLKLTLLWNRWLPFHGKNHRHRPQCPRADLNKKSLPRPKTTTAGKPYSIGLIWARVKIIHIGNFFLNKMSLNVSTVKLFLYQFSVKITFWKIYVVGLNLGAFNFCWF